MISAIVAFDKNQTMGLKDGGLPWGFTLKADRDFYQKTIAGHPLIMGYKTYQEFERPMPHPMYYVLSRSKREKAENVKVIGSVEELLERVDESQEIYVNGGAQVYKLMLPYTDKLIITHVDGEFDGEIVFPPIDFSQWKEVDRIHIDADKDNKYPHDMVTYLRIK